MTSDRNRRVLSEAGLDRAMQHARDLRGAFLRDHGSREVTRAMAVVLCLGSATLLVGSLVGAPRLAEHAPALADAGGSLDRLQPQLRTDDEPHLVRDMDAQQAARETDAGMTDRAGSSVPPGGARRLVFNDEEPLPSAMQKRIFDPRTLLHPRLLPGSIETSDCIGAQPPCW